MTGCAVCGCGPAANQYPPTRRNSPSPTPQSERRLLMPNRPGFVSSRDIPPDLAEPLAYTAHRRGCGSFNGTKPVPPPQFQDTHRATDILYARIHLSDLCNALRITPSDLTAICHPTAVTTSQPEIS